jgi:starch synthase (maltosyl-transferring)
VPAFLASSDSRGQSTITTFVAETLGCTLDQTRETARAGFDYVFNSSKWWDFQGWWLIEQYNLVRETAPSISFPESHDTPRLAEESNGNVNALKQRYLFSALFSAGVMMPMGFEYGLRKQLHVIHTTPADWQRNGGTFPATWPRSTPLNSAMPFSVRKAPRIFCCVTTRTSCCCGKPQPKGDESLLILNKDPLNHQDFTPNTSVTTSRPGAPLKDVSPEYPLEYSTNRSTTAAAGTRNCAGDRT